MSTVSVYTTVNTVSVSNTNNSVAVTQQVNQVDLTLGTIVGVSRTYYSISGGSFSGANGASSRVYTSGVFSFSASCQVVLGKNVLVRDTEFIISTVSSTNDTITILLPLYNDDLVMLWT